MPGWLTASRHNAGSAAVTTLSTLDGRQREFQSTDKPLAHDRSRRAP